MYIGALEPASNKATYSETFRVIDRDTGEDLDVTEKLVKFQILDSCGGLVLAASTVTGEIIPENGFFTVTFTKARMGALCPGTYGVGCIIADPDDEEYETDPYISGSISVLDGKIR